MCLFAWNGGNIVLQSRKALWDIEGEREGCWGDIDCRRACGVVRLRQAILPAYAEAVVSLTTSLFGPVASKAPQARQVPNNISSRPHYPRSQR